MRTRKSFPPARRTAFIPAWQQSHSSAWCVTATDSSARRKSVITPAPSMGYRWKTPGKSRASRPRWTPVSPRCAWRLRPGRIYSWCIMACSGHPRIRGPAKNTRCSRPCSRTIWRFTVRTCRWICIRASATTSNWPALWASKRVGRSSPATDNTSACEQPPQCRVKRLPHAWQPPPAADPSAFRVDRKFVGALASSRAARGQNSNWRQRQEWTRSSPGKDRTGLMPWPRNSD